MKIIVEEGQSIYDIAIANGGSIDSIFDLLEDNPDVLPTLDTPLLAGMELELKTVRNEEVATYFGDRKMKINSHTNTAADQDGGGGEPEPPTGDFNNDFNNDFYK